MRDAPARKPTVRVTQYSSLNRRAGRTGRLGAIAWYVRLALQALIRCSGQIIAGVVASLALVACGSGGQNQASHEPKGNFKVAVASATFPASQRLAQKTHLVIAVRNTGTEGDPEPGGDDLQRHLRLQRTVGAGTSAQAFAQDLNQPYSRERVATDLDRRSAPGAVPRTVVRTAARART